MADLEKRLADLEQAEDYFSAIELLEEACTSEPDNLDARFRLGVFTLEVGRVERARSLLESCLEAGYRKIGVYLNLGHALKAMGDFSGAAECYTQVLENGSELDAAIGYWSLADLKNAELVASRLDDLRSRLDACQTLSPARALFLFTLAFIYDQRGEITPAFRAMKEANDIIAVSRPFRGDLYGQLVTSLVDGVKGNALSARRDGPTPIFVIGMPRSGSTLVEQILASHSLVEATDELPYMNRIGLELEKSGGYAAQLDGLGADRAAYYAMQYLENVAPYRILQAPFFVDKNPTNFVNVGLIFALFPEAKVINVVRDPLDNAMSMYKQYFHKGNDFSFTLEGIIYYWQGYLTLMHHWLTLYPGKILNFSHQGLVTDPDESIRRLLAYCGLETQEQCFRFYASERPVLTPSASQVRTPVSSQYSGAGLKYQQHIGEYISALAEIKLKSGEILGP